VSRIVAKLDCWGGASGVNGLAGESCGGGRSGNGFERLSCRLKLRACCGSGVRVPLDRRGAEISGAEIGEFSSDGTWDSGGRRRESLGGLPGAILLMPRKAEDRISEDDLEVSRSSDSESERRLK
jgi:hypothetical protein